MKLFGRTELLVGTETMRQLAQKRVIVFGVGGVGSWCVESLVRTGIGHITIVDADLVCESNINRQLMATTVTVGQSKVEAMKKRLLEINPELDILALQSIYTEESAEDFHLETYDYIIDAIDSLKDKASLILHATRTDAVFFSSMGAALKSDPTKIKVAEFWKVKGDPLARALRQRFKKMQTFPQHKFRCVFSEEVMHNRGEGVVESNNSLLPAKAQVNGTLAHITAIFGFMLAGLVVEDILKMNEKS